MRTLQHKLIRQRIRINVLRLIPDTQKRNQILLSDFLSNVPANLVLVRHLCIFISPVVELQPVQLLIEGYRMIQMKPFPHPDLIQPFQIQPVRHLPAAYIASLPLASLYQRELQLRHPVSSDILILFYANTTF